MVSLRKLTKFTGNFSILNFSGLLESHTAHQLCQVTRTSDGAATAKCLEPDIADHIRILVNTNLKLHDITASGGANKTSGNIGIVLVETANFGTVSLTQVGATVIKEGHKKDKWGAVGCIGKEGVLSVCASRSIKSRITSDMWKWTYHYGGCYSDLTVHAVSFVVIFFLLLVLIFLVIASLCRRGPENGLALNAGKGRGNARRHHGANPGNNSYQASEHFLTCIFN